MKAMSRNLRASMVLAPWLLVLALAGCGGAAAPVPATATVPVAGQEAPTMEAQPTTTVPPTPFPDEALTPSASGAFTETLVSQVAALTGIAADEIQIVKAVPTDFPDSSLGCPDPATSYMLVVTPGFVVTVDAAGETMNFNSDLTGGQIVQCDAYVTPDATPEPTPSSDAAGAAGGIRLNDAEQAVLDMVSRETGIPVEDLRIVSREEREWPDGSLGCPDPAALYAAVVTPGFLTIVESPEGERFRVHSGMEGAGTICTNADPEASTRDGEGTDPGQGTNLSAGPLPDAAAGAVAAASRAAADFLGVDAGDVALEGWEEVIWPDSSLGCAAPDMMYLQVLTPGYRLVFHHSDKVIAVHTNRGDNAVVCDNGQPVTPASSDQ